MKEVISIVIKLLQHHVPVKCVPLINIIEQNKKEMITILQNTIDVFIRKIGYAKCIAWIDYGSQTNTVWKCRIYETGRIINAYDDDILMYNNSMDGEDKLNIPAEWEK